MYVVETYRAFVENANFIPCGVVFLFYLCYNLVKIQNESGNNVMALIVCPECGKEISDKSEVCIHCGYPLINTKCNINGIIYDFKEELPIALLEKTDDYVSAIGKIRKKTSLTLTDGCDLVDIIREIKAIPETFTPKYPLEDREKLYGDSKVKNVECPYCHSKDTKKISSLSKAGSVALFGVFALGKTSKQWHCNN